MNLEEIQKEWDQDAHIDTSQLDHESLKVPILHAKYYKIFIKERLQLKKLEADYRVDEMEKYTFYINGPTKEQHEKGWKLPPQGKIIRTEVDKYLQADQELIQKSLKIMIQREKVEFLQTIIDSLNRRSFIIKNAIDFMRWSQGSI